MVLGDKNEWTVVDGLGCTGLVSIISNGRSMKPSAIDRASR